MGVLALPGFVDVHVHFRDPGTPAAETTATGLAAAARGGFAAVVTMPNTSRRARRIRRGCHHAQHLAGVRFRRGHPSSA